MSAMANSPARADVSTTAGIHLSASLPPAGHIAVCLTGIVLVLVSLSTAGQIARHVYGHTQLKGFVPMFYVDQEASVPTWYSSAALLLASVLMALFAATKRARKEKFWLHWAALSVIFCLMSADEIAMLHEYPIEPLRQGLKLDGALYYAWVIPGALFVVAVGIGFARALFDLPARTRWLMVLAGGIFVGGAIGVEMLSGAWASGHGEENLTYALIATVEELCEMLGMVLMIYAALDYLAPRLGSLEVKMGACRVGPANRNPQ